MELTLIRHGETEWTDRGLLHGRLDSPLSAAGRLHAAQAGQRLRGQRFDALYTSPSGRAQQTAEILGQATGLVPQVLPGLQEVSFGWLEGKPMALVDPAGQGARLWRPFVRLILALTGEPRAQVGRRVAEAIDILSSRHPQGRVVAVTHWGILSMLMAQLLDHDPATWRRYAPWTACGITELKSVAGAWQVVCRNDGAHLQAPVP